MTDDQLKIAFLAILKTQKDKVAIAEAHLAREQVILDIMQESYDKAFRQPEESPCLCLYVGGTRFLVHEE